LTKFALVLESEDTKMEWVLEVFFLIGLGIPISKISGHAGER